MTIQELLEIRNNNSLRDDFLIDLTRRNKKTIFNFSRKIAGSFANGDLIHNECTQYFMLGANRGIDQANIIDDGRGNNNPEGYCIYLGTQNIRDFLMKEFKLTNKNRIEFCEIEESYDTPTSNLYENEVLGNILIEEIIEKLKPLDRQILQLIMYGETNGKHLIPMSENNGSFSNNLVKTIANTLGYSKDHIYTRIYVLRNVFTALPIH